MEFSVNSRLCLKQESTVYAQMCLLSLWVYMVVCACGKFWKGHATLLFPLVTSAVGGIVGEELSYMHVDILFFLYNK